MSFESLVDQARRRPPSGLKDICRAFAKNVPLRTLLKEFIPYEDVFTAGDVVNTVKDILFPTTHNTDQSEIISPPSHFRPPERRILLEVVHHLQYNLVIHEVDWDSTLISISNSQYEFGGWSKDRQCQRLYTFYRLYMERGHNLRCTESIWPTGVIMVFSDCYSYACRSWSPSPHACFSPTCPRRSSQLCSDDGTHYKPRDSTSQAPQDVDETKDQSDQHLISSISAKSRAYFKAEVLDEVEELTGPFSTTLDSSTDIAHSSHCIGQSLRKSPYSGSTPQVSQLRQSEVLISILASLMHQENSLVQDLDMISTYARSPQSIEFRSFISASDLPDFSLTLVRNVQRFRDAIFSFHQLLATVNPSKEVTDIVKLFLTAIDHLEGAYNRLIADFIACERILRGWGLTCAVFHDAIQLPITRSNYLFDLRKLLHRPGQVYLHYRRVIEALSRISDSQIKSENAEIMKARIAFDFGASVKRLLIYQGVAHQMLPWHPSWMDILPDYMKVTVSERERVKQEITWEFINSVVWRVEHLRYAEVLFLQPLCTSEIIPLNRKKSFLSSISQNYAEFYDQQREFLHQLQDLQRTEHPSVRNFGRLIYLWLQGSQNLLIAFLSTRLRIGYAIDQELSRNQRFREFEARQMRVPQARRTGLKSHLLIGHIWPIRIKITIDGILQRSEDSDVDKGWLLKSLEILKSIYDATEKAVVASAVEVEIEKAEKMEGVMMS